ncbi:MAG: 1-pyrroline-5-carboxylate dehydrogenase, partial [Plantibacter flavus]
ERNVFRYVPREVHVRLVDGGSVAELLRVVAAGATAGATVHVSSAVALPPKLVPAVEAIAGGITVESEDRWYVTAASLVGTKAGARVRIIGGTTEGVAHATSGSPDVAIYAGDVTEAGRIELLPFLQEQAVSITAHRFGTPNHLSDELI